MKVNTTALHLATKNAVCYVSYALKMGFDIQSEVPFNVTAYVEEHRRYQLSGCNIPDGSVRVEVVWLENTEEQVELLGFFDAEDDIDDAIESVYQLIHNDLIVPRTAEELKEEH